MALMEKRELRNLGSKVWQDHPDPNQLFSRKGAECNPTRVDIMLEGPPRGGNCVFNFGNSSSP